MYIQIHAYMHTHTHILTIQRNSRLLFKRFRLSTDLQSTPSDEYIHSLQVYVLSVEDDGALNEDQEEPRRGHVQ